MGNSSLFFSLRWKLAILFSAGFLILQTTFSYFAYSNAQANFENDRKTIQQSHINIAATLTKDSFLVLEQFAELASMANGSKPGVAIAKPTPVMAMDEYWSRWQLIWDIENSAFFGNDGVIGQILG